MGAEAAEAQAAGVQAEAVAAVARAARAGTSNGGGDSHLKPSEPRFLEESGVLCCEPSAFMVKLTV